VLEGLFGEADAEAMDAEPDEDVGDVDMQICDVPKTRKHARLLETAQKSQPTRGRHEVSVVGQLPREQL
jgi:hypothetical protein